MPFATACLRSISSCVQSSFAREVRTAKNIYTAANQHLPLVGENILRELACLGVTQHSNILVNVEAKLLTFLQQGLLLLEAEGALCQGARERVDKPLVRCSNLDRSESDIDTNRLRHGHTTRTRGSTLPP